MGWSPRVSPAGPWRVPSVTLLGAIVALLVGCGSTDRVSRKAEAACLDRMQQDFQFARYGLNLAARYDGPFARQLLVDHLLSDNYQTALAAAKGISDAPDPAAEEALRQVFADKEGALRLSAAVALAKLGDAEASEWLKQQIDGVGGPAKLNVLAFLGKQGEQDLVRPIVQKMMDSESQAGRDEAYLVLGEIGEPWATKLLLQGLEREHGKGRKQAIVALGITGDPAVAAELTPFVNTRGLVFATLEALGRLGNPDVEPALEKMLAKDEPLAQLYAGTALWKLGLLEEPQATLGPLTTVQDPQVRSTLAEQLASVNDPAALSMLLALAGDTNPDVRAAAVRAFSEQADAATQAALLERVEDPAYTVSTAAVEALGRMGGPETIERLEPLLDNDNPYVAISAANAILEIKAREASASEG